MKASVINLVCDFRLLKIKNIRCHYNNFIGICLIYNNNWFNLAELSHKTQLRTRVTHGHYSGQLFL